VKNADGAFVRPWGVMLHFPDLTRPPGQFIDIAQRLPGLGERTSRSKSPARDRRERARRDSLLARSFGQPPRLVIEQARPVGGTGR
jgi:hypothetical protein